MSNAVTGSHSNWGGSQANLLKLVPPGMFTRQQAAEEVGRTYATLRRWHANGTYVPTQPPITTGKQVLWVYTKEDIRAMREIAKNQRTGPKKKEDDGGASLHPRRTGRTGGRGSTK